MTPGQVPPIAPEQEFGFMNVDTTDFRDMSRPQQIGHFEVAGYVVFPEILPPATSCEALSHEAQHHKPAGMKIEAPTINPSRWEG
jgi:hypothetical protein